MGDLANELVHLGKSIEKDNDLPPLPVPPAWTDSKQRRREAIKKLAMGQKLRCDQEGSKRCSGSKSAPQIKE